MALLLVKTVPNPIAMNKIYLLCTLLIAILFSTMPGHAQVFPAELQKGWRLCDVVQYHGEWEEPHFIREFGTHGFEADMHYGLYYKFTTHTCTRKLFRTESPYLNLRGIDQADTTTTVLTWELRNDSLFLKDSDNLVMGFKVEKLNFSELVLSETFTHPFTGLINKKFYYFQTSTGMGIMGRELLADRKYWYSVPQQDFDAFWEQDTIRFYEEEPAALRTKKMTRIIMEHLPYTESTVWVTDLRFAPEKGQYVNLGEATYYVCPGTDYNLMLYRNGQWHTYTVVTHDQTFRPAYPPKGEKWLVRKR